MRTYSSTVQDSRAGTLLSATTSAHPQFLSSHKQAALSSSRSEPSLAREKPAWPLPGNNPQTQYQEHSIRTVPSLALPYVGNNHSLYGDHDGVRSSNGRSMAESTMGVSQSLAAQQRKLISLTDKILLKRTQVLHQQGNVETCRNYMDRSSKDLIEGLRTQRADERAGRKARIARKKQRAKKEAEGSLNVGTPPTVHTVFDLEFVLETPAPENVAQSTAQDVIPAEDKPTVEELYQQFHSDSVALGLQESKLNALNDELSALEYEVAALHQWFAHQLRSKTFAASLHTALGELDLEPTNSSQKTSASGSSTPALVTDYFDAKGDTGVHRERLQDLEDTFQEGLLARAMISERGDYLEVSDAAFQENYNSRRKKHEEDLRMAEERAMKLASECREAGLDIDKYRRNGLSVRAASIPRRPSSIIDPLIPVTDVIGDQGYAASGDGNLPVHDRSTEKVDSWLDGMTGDPAQPQVDDWDMMEAVDTPETEPQQMREKLPVMP